LTRPSVSVKYAGGFAPRNGRSPLRVRSRLTARIQAVRPADLQPKCQGGPHHRVPGNHHPWSGQKALSWI